MTRLRRTCCEDPAPERRPANVTPFPRRPPGRRPDADGLGRTDAARRPSQPGRPESSDDPDLPLPLIPPGLNEGFGLW